MDTGFHEYLRHCLRSFSLLGAQLGFKSKMHFSSVARKI